jgi:hypothetical protein
MRRKEEKVNLGCGESGILKMAGRAVIVLCQRFFSVKEIGE